MSIDINPLTKVVNAYTLQPYKLGDTCDQYGFLNMLFAVKAIVSKNANGKIVYALYRCGWDGTPNSDPSMSDGVPQGMQIYASPNDIEDFAWLLFPVLKNGGAIPDPYMYGVEEDKPDDHPEPPTTCPNCGCDELNCTDTTHEDELILRSYDCRHCKVTWTETYRFIGWEYD